METNIEKLRSDIRYESRKFAIQLVVGVAALVGAAGAAGTALGNYLAHHAPSQPPQIIYIPAPAPAPP